MDEQTLADQLPIVLGESDILTVPNAECFSDETLDLGPQGDA